jgi:hypothetical protein
MPPLTDAAKSRVNHEAGITKKEALTSLLRFMLTSKTNDVTTLPAAAHEPAA